MNCSTTLPSYKQAIEAYDYVHWIAISISVFWTLCILGLSLIHLILILTRTAMRGLVPHLLVISSVLPITACLCTCVLLLPRTTALCELLMTLYLNLSIMTYLRLVVGLFGGKEKMIDSLNKQEKTIRFQRSIWCLLCRNVLPPVKATRGSVQLLLMLVGQVAIAHTIVSVIQGLLHSDDPLEPLQTRIFLYSMAVEIISTMVALYGLSVLYGVIGELLRRYQVLHFNNSLWLLLLMINAQPPFVRLIGRALIQCDSVFPSSTRATMYAHMMIVAELLIMSVVMTILCAPKRCALFLHPHNSVQDPISANNNNTAARGVHPAGVARAWHTGAHEA